MTWITEPCPWYIAGPLIALLMFILLFFGKNFGMSSNLRTMCSLGGAGKFADLFRFDWREEKWNLVVVAGAVLGGFFASQFLSDNAVNINPVTADKLAQQYNINSANSGTYMPTELFGAENLSDPYVLTVLVVGGFLVGFGSRYAGGCTSGHAISGLSNLQMPSLYAVVGFFVGGLIMIHFIYPLLFPL